MSSPPRLRITPATRRAVDLILAGGSAIGLAIGINALVLHLTTDPLADTRAYYDAAVRLNHGVPLYDQDMSDSTGLYLYPPLLAILFRPLATLPFEVAAAVWQVVVIGALALALVRIGIRRRTVLVLGMLAMPILWTLSIGQAETLVTLLLTIGSPWSVAVAGHLKLAPWLAAIYWVGRRDVGSLARFGVVVAAVAVAQFVLEPAGTLAYLRLEWMNTAFQVRNISPFVIHPALWAAVVGVLAVLALRYAPTRAGWPLAVALAVLVYPRLLAYQLSSLIAAFGGPRDRSGGR